MAEIRDRMERRHVREKTIIDHLAERVFDPAASVDDEHTVQKSNTSTGLPVEGQVRKEWNPPQGRPSDLLPKLDARASGKGAGGALMPQSRPINLSVIPNADLEARNTAHLMLNAYTTLMTYQHNEKRRLMRAFGFGVSATRRLLQRTEGSRRGIYHLSQALACQRALF